MRERFAGVDWRKRRWSSPADPESPTRRGLTDHIRLLERRVADVDRELDQTIATSLARRAKDDLLQRVPGVGPVVSRTLLGDVPELA